jgi:hypothetical protein
MVHFFSQEAVRGMALTAEAGDPVDTLCARIQECIAPYAGRVEYGNLRSKISRWDCGGGEPITNVALVYETPGGSTDQINVSFHHHSGLFSIVDVNEGEINTQSVDEVMECIRPRVSGIPNKRLEHLYGEIRRQVDSGTDTAGLFGHLNRIIQSEFRGGTITHLELRDAMTYAMQYMKSKASSC